MDNVQHNFVLKKETAVANLIDGLQILEYTNLGGYEKCIQNLAEGSEEKRPLEGPRPKVTSFFLRRTKLVIACVQYQYGNEFEWNLKN
jgi:hypothetical protein